MTEQHEQRQREREVDEMRRSDPEMFELHQADQRLDRETHEVSETLRRTRDEREKDELRGKLNELVNEHFNVRQERRRLELRRLERELDKLRKSIEGREERRGEIIERHVKELAGDEHDLGF